MDTKWIVLICIGSVIWLFFGGRAWYDGHRHHMFDSITPAPGQPGPALLVPFGIFAYLVVHWMIRSESQIEPAKQPTSLKKETD